MEGSSMSSIMLMVTMVVLSWRSSMMEKHIILNTLGMVDMCNTVLYLKFIYFIFDKNTKQNVEK